MDSKESLDRRKAAASEAIGGPVASGWLEHMYSCPAAQRGKCNCEGIAWYTSPNFLVAVDQNNLIAVVRKH